MHKILLVDDELFEIEGLNKMISWEKYGYKVIGQASNGVEALERIVKEKPELVITDIKMPLMNGLELMKSCCQRHDINTRFIVLSGYDEFDYAKKSMKYGAKNYLLKPVDENELILMLKDIYEEIQRENESNFEIEIVSNSTIERVIQGEKKESVFNRLSFILGIDTHDKIWCMIVEPDHYESLSNQYGEEEIESLRSCIFKCIANGIGGFKNKLNIFDYQNKGFGVIITKKILGSIDIKSLVNNIKGSIKTNCGHGVSVFVGGMADGIKEFKISYEQALIARQYKFFEGGECTILFNQICDSLDKHKSLKPDQVHYIAERIENGKKEEFLLAIDKLFMHLKEKRVSPDIVKMYIDMLVFEVIHIIEEMNGEVDCAVDKYSELLNKRENLVIIELMEKLKKYAVFVHEKIKQIRKKQLTGTFDKIEEYVNNNYKNNINIKGIAKTFYLSPIYVGQLFKKSTGMYFNDYLHKKRIEQAKTLLIRTDMRIYEIAGRVGYVDADYFVNKFSKYERMSPTKYRKIKKVSNT